MEYFIIHSISGSMYPIKIETNENLTDEKIIEFKSLENDKDFNLDIISMKNLDFIEHVDEQQYNEYL